MVFYESDKKILPLLGYYTVYLPNILWYCPPFVVSNIAFIGANKPNSVFDTFLFFEKKTTKNSRVVGGV